MAFRRGAKEMKKQSYYVWFLGAKESRGLRGLEYIGPVLRFLLEREREVEPPKVTLQVSGKGIKMVQNIARGVRGKMEQVKHLIPQHAVTCVHQDGDLVCCILLLYNPVTRCPVHVHVYRCDSSETATMLRQQLQQLVERPDNQTKFREIEHRLAAKGLLREHSFHNHHHHHPGPPRMPSDGRTEDGSEDRSDVSEEDEEGLATSPPRRTAAVLPAPVRGAASVGSATSSDRMASLYASLAAELREKLSNPDRGPLLLPPKDYGTVCKRSSARPEGGSKSSSGIGSDELLPRELDSSSDEEWPAQHQKREQRRNRRPVSFPAAAAAATVFGGPQQKQRQPHPPHRQIQTPQPYRNGHVPQQQRPFSQQQQHPPSHRQSASSRQMVVPESKAYPQHHQQQQQQQPEPLRQHNQKRSRDYRHSFVEPSTRRPLPL